MCLQQGEDIRFREVEAQSFQRDFELVVVDVRVFVKIEEGELKHIIQGQPLPFSSHLKMHCGLSYCLVDLLPLLLAQCIQCSPLLSLSPLPLYSFLPITL